MTALIWRNRRCPLCRKFVPKPYRRDHEAFHRAQTWQELRAASARTPAPLTREQAREFVFSAKEA